ncbi:MAG: hypothetical protein ABI042_00335 [Verrucomicrobiota bacterium]
MKNFLALFILLVVAPFSKAEDPSTNRIENRFLFIVETSSAMGRSAKATQQTLRELIESGAQGQMRPGDTFSLWTFQEKLDTTFPLQHWSADENKKLSAVAIDFLKQHRFEKKAKLETVLPPLYSLVKSSKAITVILISTGSEPIHGSTFDQEINVVYTSNFRKLRDSKIPFVTAIVGRRGVPVAYAVNSPRAVNIPNPPLPEIAPVLTKTNTVAPTNPPIAPKRFAKQNIIISKPIVTNPPVAGTTPVPIQTNQIADQTNAPPAIASTTNTALSTLPNPPVATQTVALSQNAVTTNFAIANSQTSAAPLALTSHDDPTKFTPGGQNSNGVGVPPSNAVVAVASSQIPAKPKNKFLFSAALGFVIVAIFFFVRHSRNKSETSLISRSMNQRPK